MDRVLAVTDDNDGGRARERTANRSASSAGIDLEVRNLRECNKKAAEEEKVVWRRREREIDSLVYGKTMSGTAGRGGLCIHPSPSPAPSCSELIGQSSATGRPPGSSCSRSLPMASVSVCGYACVALAVVAAATMAAASSCQE